MDFNMDSNIPPTGLTLLQRTWAYEVHTTAACVHTLDNSNVALPINLQITYKWLNPHKKIYGTKEPEALFQTYSTGVSEETSVTKRGKTTVYT